MWAKFKIIEGNIKVIRLPDSINKITNDLIFIYFGKKLACASVQQYNSDNENTGEYFEKPLIIEMTQSLVDSILIKESQLYKIVLKKSNILIGPVIGLLLGNHAYRYSPQHMKKYSDRLGIYSSIGGLIYGFTPNTIDWINNTAYGLYYNYESESWEYGNFPLPEVIYRRDFHLNQEYVRKLINISGGKLYNSHRFTKFQLYEFLNKDTKFKEFLPPTELLIRTQQVKEFLKKYNRIILKPIDLSRGRGICIIEKTEYYYSILDCRHDKVNSFRHANEDELDEFLNLNKEFLTSYIVQKHIKLARVDDSVFDVRVVMQRDRFKKWVCNGIECRVAANDSLITNISRGGYALRLEEALRLAFPQDDNTNTIHTVNDFCTELCYRLEGIGEHFAEFGIDVAIDEDKKIWLIEVNVFPSFKGFKTMDYKTYLSIRYAPLLYAVSLTEFNDG